MRVDAARETTGRTTANTGAWESVGNEPRETAEREGGDEGGIEKKN